MYCVVNCIQIQCLCTFCKIKFTCSCTVFCIYTHFQIFLCGIGNHFTQQLCKLRCMLSFLICCFFIIHSDFRITFTVSYTCHCQVHTNLAAFTFKVHAQIVHDIFRRTLCNTDNMLCCPAHFTFLLCEFFSRRLTDRTKLRSCIPFVNITANTAYKFSHNQISSF